MEQLNLRVKSNKLSICVNDEGDSVTLNLDDNRFINKFLEFADFGKKMPFSEDESDEVKYKKMLGYTQKLCHMIDELFGSGATYKIFEAYEPTYDLIADFVLKLEPIMNKAMEMKEKSIEKQKDRFENRAKKRESKR